MKKFDNIWMIFAQYFEDILTIFWWYLAIFGQNWTLFWHYLEITWRIFGQYSYQLSANIWTVNICKLFYTLCAIICIIFSCGMQLNLWPCMSVCLSVCPSICLSVPNFFTSSRRSLRWMSSMKATYLLQQENDIYYG